MSYLTEKKLFDYLKIIYPKVDDWIHNKTVVNSGSKFRPDYLSDSLKIIVEFNGYSHYTNSKRIMMDEQKKQLFTELGYKYIEIPYFVQMSKDMIKHYFNKSIKIKQIYPHGFIDLKVITPSDFCSLGALRFHKECFKLNEKISKEILNSLRMKSILIYEKLTNAEYLNESIEYSSEEWNYAVSLIFSNILDRNGSMENCLGDNRYSFLKWIGKEEIQFDDYTYFKKFMN